MIDLMIPSAITVGPVQIHLYGLLLGIGFAIIYLVFSERYKDRIKTIDYIVAVLLTILGARTLFILHNFSSFIEDPLIFFRLTSGGLALYGAIIGLLLGIFYVSKRRRLHFFELSDLLLTYLPLAQAIGRFGNFLNHELYGTPTDRWWGIYIPLEDRLPGYEQYDYFQPAFLFEAILDLLNFFILRYLLKRSRSGVKTAIYFLNYGIIRLLVNRVRIDKEFFYFIETSDLFSILAISCSLILLVYLYSSEVKQTFRLSR